MNEQILDDKLLDEATEWFVAMRAENISDQLSDRFVQWISQSDLHHAAYAEIGGFWDGLSVMEAGLSSTQASTVTSLADHKAQKTSQKNMSSQKNIFRMRQWSPRMIAASIAVLVVSVIGVQYGDHLFLDRHSTQIGEIADIILDDGSHLVLNTNSEVRVDLQNDRRVVYLEQGEVFFEVAKDQNRPFFVETSGGLVRVLGTKFNIRQKGSISNVTVLEGRVGVMDYGRIKSLSEMPSLDATLNMDQQFVLGDDAIENVAAPIDSKAVLSWRDRKLVYNGEKFSTLVEDLNRYYKSEIRIGNPALNDIEVVAILKVEDQATTLKALEKTFNITARPVSKDLITLYPNK